MGITDNLYDMYKPLRNKMRRLETRVALMQIWALIKNIKGEGGLPTDFHHLPDASIRKHVYEWDLALLAREVILNGGNRGDASLLRYRDFASIINLLKKTTEAQSKLFVNDSTIQHEVHRVGQQQFPFQTDQKKLYRFFKIFRDPALDKIFFDVTGLTVGKFLFLGLSVSGSLMSNPRYSIRQSFKDFGISDKERDAFFQRVVVDLGILRNKTKAVQEYNENWSYTFNPLLTSPLVIDPQDSGMAICPIRSYFNSRIGEGLVFDIFKKRKGSEEVYGKAYEAYVAWVTDELINDPSLTVISESEYYVGKNLKHGFDLYLYDDTYALLIECKAKRLKLSSRYQGKESALNADLQVLAKSIVQCYKNLLDILNKQTNWDCGERTLRPVVVSLMECYMWMPEMQMKLENFILEKLVHLGISPEIITQHPYSLMSISEFEMSLQIINRIGLRQFFADKQAARFTGWAIDSFVHTNYSDLIPSLTSNYLQIEINQLMEEFAGPQQ